MARPLLLLLLLASLGSSMKPRCKVEDRIKLVLRAMTPGTVAAVVDCVVRAVVVLCSLAMQVGKGRCDATGREVKGFARTAVCLPR